MSQFKIKAKWMCEPILVPIGLFPSSHWMKGFVHPSHLKEGVIVEHIDYLMVHEYLEKLADPSFPGPASGSAAATVAAMAAALLEMSCKVTMKQGEGNVPFVLNEIVKIRHQCLALATEDMKVLAEVVRAAKSRKEFPEKYEHAMRSATDTLVSIVKNCEFILRQIEQLLPICNKRVVAELKGGTYMAEAALASAKFGVEVNLHFLQDEDYIETVQNAIKKSYRNGVETKDSIMNIINK